MRNENSIYESAKHRDHSRQREVRVYRRTAKALVATGYWLLAFVVMDWRLKTANA